MNIKSKYFPLDKTFYLVLIAAGLFFIHPWSWLGPVAGIGIAMVTIILVTIELWYLWHVQIGSFERKLPETVLFYRENQVKIILQLKSKIPMYGKAIDFLPEECITNQRPELKYLFRPGRITYADYLFTPQKRGPLSFTGFGLRVHSRWKLVARQFQLIQKHDFLVYPGFSDEDRRTLETRFLYNRRERRATGGGPFGTQFKMLREYQRGDDPRKIEWKRTATRQKLLFREEEPERGLNLFVMVDAGRLMMARAEGLSKVDWSVNAAMNLAYLAQIEGDILGGLGFHNRVHSMMVPKRDANQISRMATFLSGLNPVYEEPDYYSAFDLALRTLKGRSLVLLFTDIVDPWLSESLTDSVLHMNRRHRVMVCVLEDPWLDSNLFAFSGNTEVDLARAFAREARDNRNLVLQKMKMSGVKIVRCQPQRLKDDLILAYRDIRGF